jgi:hypothetical protein
VASELNSAAHMLVLFQGSVKGKAMPGEAQRVPGI